MSEQKARIGLHPDTCISAGNCVEVAEDYFDQDEVDGRVIILADEVESGDKATVEEAVEVCPVHALFLSRGTS